MFELTGPAGTDVSLWTVSLYNHNSVVYDSHIIPSNTILPDEGGGWGTYALAITIQNGPNDGLALSNNLGMIVDFVSYEGSLTPNDGPAAGITAFEIPVR